MILDFDKSGWNLVSLGSVVRNTNEVSHNPLVVGVEHFVGLEHLEPGDLKVEAFGHVSEGTTFTKRVRPGQTLFGKRRAYQRKVAFADFDAVCSGDILALEPSSDSMIPELLPFLISSEGFYERALKTSAGSLSPRTRWADLESFEFLLPPIEEQKRIAQLLWSVEHHLRNLRELHLEVKSAVRTLSVQYFEGSATQTQVQFREIGELAYGKGLVSSKRVAGDYAVVGSTGIIDTHNQAIVDGPVVIVGRKGNAGNVIWMESDCYPIDTTFYLKLKSSDVFLKYIYHFLRQVDLYKLTETTAVPGLNRERVHALSVPLPTMEVQLEVVRRIESLEFLCSSVPDEIESLKILAQSISIQIFGDA
jgi:type I restriction enzyme S subunit